MKRKVIYLILTVLFVAAGALVTIDSNAKTKAKDVSANCGFDDEEVCCVAGTECGCLL